MEGPSRYSRNSQLQVTNSSMKQRKSGYEPSDTEAEWHDSPWYDRNQEDEELATEGSKMASNTARNISPMRLSRRQSARFEYDVSSTTNAPVTSPPRRRHSKSPYKAPTDGGNAVSPTRGLDLRRNVSPFRKPERRRHVSPYKPGREEFAVDEDDEIVSTNRRQNYRLNNKQLGLEDKPSQLLETSRVSEKTNFSSRSLSATRARSREKDRQVEQRMEGALSPLTRSTTRKQWETSEKKSPSGSEINEMVANAKLSRLPSCDAPTFESTESISPGDIFFCRATTALGMQKNVLPNNGGYETRFVSKPLITERDSTSHQRNGENGSYDDTSDQRNSSGNVLSQSIKTSNSTLSGQTSSKISTGSSRRSDASGRTSKSLQKFIANRRKSQTDAWFACVRTGPCKPKKSPERNRTSAEAAYIKKAFVVEHLRQFWADKHQPASFNGFICHKQEAQLLKQLVSHEICPHILFKGPSGSGKRALTMALLREIYGDLSWNISQELRYFNTQERRPIKVAVPLTSSAHHVELNVNSEPNARYALMALVKEISSNYAITPEVSNVNFKADYKVIVLYEVDKAAENIQHLIKWIMDCYSDACKLMLCCEDEVNILEPVKNRCKVIKVDAPVTHEIMEVLIQIAKKEDFDLSISFAAKIAKKSKQNLRRAIMALEACKAHNYPFVDDQPIPVGWEEVLVELAAEILADPSHQRLFLVRGRLQKLLVDFVHPKLILQKLVELFLKRVEASLKRDLYYWHAHYDKRLPTGTSALLKLEEFAAKFMSMQRKSVSSRQHI